MQTLLIINKVPYIIIFRYIIMSINCLLTNDVILEKLAVKIGGGGGAVSATLPLVATANDVSLPIAGTWSATDNVVKGSSATALVWAPDAGLPVPTIVGVDNPIDATPWFNVGSEITYNQAEYAGLFTIYTQVIGATTQLTATNAILATDKPTFAFLIPSFQLLGTYSYPATVFAVGGVVSVCHMTITPFSAGQSACTVNISGLACALGDVLTTYLPSFTLCVGM